jgi:hypothetical protein
MTLEPRRRVAVTVQTKAVKPRLHAYFQIRAGAAMTLNTGVGSEAIRIVVVAGQAVGGGVFGMIEVQGQPFRTAQHRFTERDTGAARDQSAECKQGGNDDADDECRMPAEREPARDGSLVRRRSRATPAPEEHGYAARRDGEKRNPTTVTSGISIRGNHMGRQ